MEEIEERFKNGNDSLASYWLTKAADDILTAYLHSEKVELLDIASELYEKAKKLDKEGY